MTYVVVLTYLDKKKPSLIETRQILININSQNDNENNNLV